MLNKHFHKNPSHVLSVEILKSVKEKWNPTKPTYALETKHTEIRWIFDDDCFKNVPTQSN